MKLDDLFKNDDPCNRNVWNIQAEFDFGLGSVFGEHPWMVSATWNKFLHFADADRSPTVRYEFDDYGSPLTPD